MGRLLSQITKDNLLNDYLLGVSVTQLAKKYDVSREAIYNHLRTMGNWRTVKTHLREGRMSDNTKRLLDLSDEIVSGWLVGVSMVNLGVEFQATPKMISKIIKNVMGTTKRRYQRDLQIVEEYENGMTQIALSKKYGISQPNICRIINALDS